MDNQNDNVMNLVFFIQDKIQGKIKDNDYINLMMLVSKIYLDAKKKNDEIDDDKFESYTADYIENYT